MVDAETAWLLALEGGAALLAGVTGAATLRAWRLARSQSLLLLGLGFVGLALSQAALALLEWLTATAESIAPDRADRFDVLFWGHYASGLAGFGLVFLSFGRRPFRWAAAVGPVLLRAGPVLQFALTFAAFLVVLHAGLNHILRARVGSLRTAVGFFLLLVGQFLSLYVDDYNPLTPQTLWGQAAAAAGFLLLFLAVVRPVGSK